MGRRSPRSARVSLRWGGVIGPRLARSGQALGRDGTNPASTTNTARKAGVRSRTGPRVGRSFSGMSAYLRSPQRVYVISQQLHFAPAPLHASRVHRRIHALHGGRSGRRSARDHGSSSSPPTRPRPCSPPGPAKTRGSASFGVRRAERRGAGSPNPCRGAVALWRPARVLGRGKHPDLGAPRLSARSRRRSRAFFEIRRRSVTKKKMCTKKKKVQRPPPSAPPPPLPNRPFRSPPAFFSSSPALNALWVLARPASRSVSRFQGLYVHPVPSPSPAFASSPFFFASLFASFFAAFAARAERSWCFSSSVCPRLARATCSSRRRASAASAAPRRRGVHRLARPAGAARSAAPRARRSSRRRCARPAPRRPRERLRGATAAARRLAPSHGRLCSGSFVHSRGRRASLQAHPRRASPRPRARLRRAAATAPAPAPAPARNRTPRARRALRALRPPATAPRGRTAARAPSSRRRTRPPRQGARTCPGAPKAKASRKPSSAPPG